MKLYRSNNTENDFYMMQPRRDKPLGAHGLKLEKEVFACPVHSGGKGSENDAPRNWIMQGNAFVHCMTPFQ